MGGPVSRPLSVALPPQPFDARQLSWLPPVVGDEALRIVLDGWSRGVMPRLVRVAWDEKKRRLGWTEARLARELRISREHLSNARHDTYTLSPDFVARVKRFLLPEAFPAPPARATDEARQRPPRHRRGGKRPPPDPTPPLPGLRLFTLIESTGERRQDVAEQNTGEVAA